MSNEDAPSPSDPLREQDAESDALESSYRFLVANCEGVLVFEEHRVPVKFVTDSSTGRLIMATPVAVFFASEVILLVPDETEDAMQLLISPEQIDEGAATDRWMAYHGDPEQVRWAMCWIDSAKLGPWVFDGDALTRCNILASAESAIIRELNADRPALAELCRRVACADVEQPTCVGVDQDGIHVRARFGVIRVPFPHTANDAEHARAMVSRLTEDT